MFPSQGTNQSCRFEMREDMSELQLSIMVLPCACEENILPETLGLVSTSVLDERDNNSFPVSTTFHMSCQKGKRKSAPYENLEDCIYSESPTYENS